MPDSRSEPRDLLSRCTLFADASKQLRHRLSAEGSRVQLERREVLFAQGAPARELLVLLSGRIRLLRRGPDERVITLGYRSAGEVAGETGWADGTHHAEGRAVERVDVLSIPRERFEGAVAEEPRLSVALFELLGRRVLGLERRMEALLTRPVESRVAEFLLDAASRHGVPDSRGQLIGVKFTHAEIASYVGSTRETVTLVLGELKRRNLITTDHRRVIVRDPDQLASLV